MTELRWPERRSDEMLALARSCARAAGDAIRVEFGRRSITQRRGQHDVQLQADLVAHNVIVTILTDKCPDIPIVSEEGSHDDWAGDRPIWVVDPLDGTNNFGYGIAHCAVIISLFVDDQVHVAVVYDPLLSREFFASDGRPFPKSASTVVDLADATVSLVSGYSEGARARAERLWPSMNRSCKRVLNLWAPGLDIALVADGSIDAMLCIDADLLDVCGSAYILKSAGGCLLDSAGNDVMIRRSMYSAPVSFVAAHSRPLALQLVKMLGSTSGSSHDCFVAS